MLKSVTITVRRSATVQVMQYTPETVDVSVVAEYQNPTAGFYELLESADEEVEKYVQDQQAKLLKKSMEAKR